MNTEIIMITDRSGSMEDLVDAVIVSFNTFLKDMASQGLREAMVTHTLFGSELQELYAGMPLYAVPQLDHHHYRIEGMTALYDALGYTLREAKARIEEENWADQVVVAILTDGDENASRYFTQDQVRKLVHECQLKGWKFIFLGANQNIVVAADKIGIDPTYAYEFNATGAGIAQAFKQIGHRVLQLGYSQGAA